MNMASIGVVSPFGSDMRNGLGVRKQKPNLRFT